MMRLVRRGGLLSLVAALVVACASPKETDVRDTSAAKHTDVRDTSRPDTPLPNQTDARDTKPQTQESNRREGEQPKQAASAEAEIKGAVQAGQAGVRKDEVQQELRRQKT